MITNNEKVFSIDEPLNQKQPFYLIKAEIEIDTPCTFELV